MVPVAILVHVPDVQLGLEWYRKAFTNAIEVDLPDFSFTVLKIDGFSIEIIRADEKVGVGKDGRATRTPIPTKVSRSGCPNGELLGHPFQLKFLGVGVPIVRSCPQDTTTYIY